ncbi:MAG: hypothetical protein J6Z36_01295, partial [Clostridia bacterium]|nr:hypothetical protein [Clostridia bacterium]
MSNYPFLDNELMDVVRLFGEDGTEISHVLSFSDGEYRNEFTVNGEKYCFTRSMPTDGEIEFKRYAKRFAKLGLYEILSKKHDITMPWGALTGIRPTKLAYTELQAGRDYKALFSDMGVSSANTLLVERILKEQNTEDFF